MIHPMVAESLRRKSAKETTVIIYQIKGEDITNNYVKPLVNFLKQLNKEHFQGLNLFTSAYDDTTDELFEIPEMREYMKTLFEKAPYLLYYLDLTSCNWALTCVSDYSFAPSQRFTDIELREHVAMGGSVPQTIVPMNVPNDLLAKIYKHNLIIGNEKRDTHGAELVNSYIEEVILL